MSKIGLASLVVLGLALAGCGDDPSLPAWPDGGGTGNDTDDPDICEPNTGSDWGEDCAKFSPDCPVNTVCQTVVGMGSSYGICSTQCCGQNDPDEVMHCPDVSPGLETCAIHDPILNLWFCAIVCNTDNHCPSGQTCQVVPDTATKICYPPQS